MNYGDFLKLAHHSTSGLLFFQRWVDDSKTAPCSTYKPFLRLLKTEVIANWASGAGRELVRARDVWAQAIVPTLLERVLLPVVHRRQPENIKAFVRCYFPNATQLLKHLDHVDWPGTIDVSSQIWEQEERYGRVLFELSQALKRDEGPPWAVDALERIARRRGLIGCPLASKLTFNIAFAIKDGSAMMRSAIIVPMSLLAIRDANVWNLSPDHVFADDFLAAVELVRRGLVAGREISHDWSFLGNQTLSGSSGTMAIAVAQYLGTDYWEGKFRHTLPPWVVISASIDPQGRAAGGTAGEVGSLGKKSEAAIEEGVRVLVIAPNPTTPLDEVTHHANFLKVLSLTQDEYGKEEVAKKLHEEKLVWAARDGMQPPVKILTDDPGDSKAWKAVQKCYSGMFPADESIDLKQLDRDSAVLIGMFIGTEVVGYALVSGTPQHTWMFGSYLWIKDDFRPDLLHYFRKQIVAACRQKVPLLRGIIFEIDKPKPGHVKLAAKNKIPFDDRVVELKKWKKIRSVVRQVRRVNLYLRTWFPSCFMIVDQNGVPVEYRQPSMHTDNTKLSYKHETPMYLLVLFADETLRPADLMNEGRDDARDALEYLLDTFWPTQSVASETCSRKHWPKYFAKMSRDLRSRVSECKLAKWKLPVDMHEIIRKSKTRPKIAPKCFDL